MKEVEVTPYPEDMEAKVFEFPEGVPVPTKGEGFGHVDKTVEGWDLDAQVGLDISNGVYEGGN